MATQDHTAGSTVTQVMSIVTKSGSGTVNAVRLTSDGPPQGREADPAEELVVVGVVRTRDTADQLHRVIVSA
jgi:hypothetical protein